MKKRWLIVLALVLCAVTVLLCACGDSGSGIRENEFSGEGSDDVENAEVVTTSGRKLVYTVRMSVTVKDLNDVCRQLSEEVSRIGGWTEQSLEGKGYRYLTYRVPVSEMNAFQDLLSGCGEVGDKSITTDDITNRYTDAERSKDLYVKEYEAYAAFYETLLDEPASSENTETKLSVLQAMQEASAKIDAYNGKLSSYDQLVDYATFSISLYEEDVYEKPSYWTELGEVFSGSVNSMGSVFGFLLKVVVAVLPYAVIIGGAVGIVVLVFKVIERVKKKKNENRVDKK